MSEKETESPTVLDILSDIFTLLEEQQEINARVANALEELVEIAKEDRPARLEQL